MQNAKQRSHAEIITFPIDSFSPDFFHPVNVEISRFSQEELERALRPLPHYQNFALIYENVVGSTGDLAREHYFRHGPAVVLAGRQTAGRGRHGRQWISDREGNVYLSIALRFPEGGEILQTLSRAIAARITENFFHQFSLPLAVKPPNDLLLAGAKVGGILLERAVPDGLIVGIGLNLVPDPDLQPRCAQPVGAVPHLSLAAAVPALCAAVADCLNFPTDPTE